MCVSTGSIIWPSALLCVSHNINSVKVGHLSGAVACSADVMRTLHPAPPLQHTPWLKMIWWMAKTKSQQVKIHAQLVLKQGQLVLNHSKVIGGLTSSKSKLPPSPVTRGC